ncbi:hypothetical protein Trydic_g2855 [Trypoxylus dichotomus]
MKLEGMREIKDENKEGRTSDRPATRVTRGQNCPNISFRCALSDATDRSERRTYNENAANENGREMIHVEPVGYSRRINNRDRTSNIGGCPKFILY